MIQSFIDKNKKHLFIEFLIYLIPFAIILGQAPLNLISVVVSIIFLILVLKNKIYYEYKSYFVFLYFLIVFFFINLIFSINPYFSTQSILGFIRYYFFFLAMLYSLSNIDNFRLIFTRILFIAVSFVIIDSYIQFFFNKDIFSYPSLNNRLTGPFGSEKVVGAYISKLIFLSFSFLIIKKIKVRYICLIAIAALALIVLSNERSSSIIFASSLVIFFIFCQEKPFFKISVFSFSAMFIFLLLNYNIVLKNRFINEPAKYYKDNHHKAHFLTAIEVFKDNKIVGSGVKTFRVACHNKKYENIGSIYYKYRCSTHPHNLYLEIIAETGILGMLIFISINIYIFFQLIKFFLKKEEFRSEILFVFCNFFILFWPLQTTGSFFSSWNGVFYWIFFAFFFDLQKKILTQKSI
tara:strand:+ start:2700 stop:3920 length:1221 start_codon:yes stop_codon:yes gene_type:complete